MAFRSIVLALVFACAALGTTVAAPRPSASVRTATPGRTAQTGSAHRRSPYVGAISVAAETGKVLFEDRADEEAYPASVTKLMTAFLVLDDVRDGKFALSDRVEASPVRTKLDRHLRQPSCIGLKAGESMTVDDLLLAMLVHSANDAAIFLAEKSAGTTEAFVVRMNAKAKTLGMERTRYYNPNGLPPPSWAKERSFNVSTCRDLVKLARALLKEHPEILKYTSVKVCDLTLPNGLPFKRVNHNNVMVKDKLKVINPDGTEAADGLKTGYIDAGGSSLVLTGTRKGRRAIVVVLGSASSKERDKNAHNLLSDALSALVW